MDLAGVRIATQRLRLEPISMDYAEVVFTEFTHEITRFMYPRAAEKIEETQEFISRSIANLRDGSHLTTVILDGATGEFLGCAGLHELGSPRPELGVWLKKSAHGSRFGFEAMSALAEWARKNLECRSLYYPEDERNIPFRCIPERLGGTIVGRREETSMSGRLLRLVEYEIPLRPAHSLTPPQ